MVSFPVLSVTVGLGLAQNFATKVVESKLGVTFGCSDTVDNFA